MMNYKMWSSKGGKRVILISDCFHLLWLQMKPIERKKNFIISKGKVFMYHTTNLLDETSYFINDPLLGISMWEV